MWIKSKRNVFFFFFFSSWLWSAEIFYFPAQKLSGAHTKALCSLLLLYLDENNCLYLGSREKQERGLLFIETQFFVAPNRSREREREIVVKIWCRRWRVFRATLFKKKLIFIFLCFFSNYIKTMTQGKIKKKDKR